jgi:hypothetical protein
VDPELRTSQKGFRFYELSFHNKKINIFQNMPTNTFIFHLYDILDEIFKTPFCDAAVAKFTVM